MSISRTSVTGASAFLRAVKYWRQDVYWAIAPLEEQRTNASYALREEEMWKIFNNLRICCSKFITSVKMFDSL